MSCSSGPEEEQGVLLARVYDKHLYAEDLGQLGNGLPPEDSAEMVLEYTTNWVNHNLLLAYAERNLPSERLDLDDQLRDYRESLIVYNYEADYLDQNLDTTVSQSEIQSYYRENQASFKLDEDLYRLRLAVVSNEAPKRDSLSMWIRSDRMDYQDALENYALRHAIHVNTNDSTWFSSADLNPMLPAEYLATFGPFTRGYGSYADSSRTYLVLITDSKIKGEPIPLGYIQPQIKKIILHKRKMNILSKLKQDIQTNATQKGHLEIFGE